MPLVLTAFIRFRHAFTELFPGCGVYYQKKRPNGRHGKGDVYMRFLKPDVLWHLLWLMPLMIVVFVVSGRRTAAVLKSFLGKHAEDPEYVQVSGGKRLLRFVILLTAVVFLVCAAARPSWGVQIQEMHGQGRDLLFVFDTSKSMLAKDVQPSRLAHAKWLVRELVKRNPGDRFGLIAFAGRAFLECPLTSDKTSFLQAVDELSTSSIPVGGTNIQAALETALQAFKAAETQHRAVVLITDGDELEGDSGKAVDEIIARKIPLFIAGIGDPAQPSIIQIPDGHGGFKTLKDNQGNIVNSPLNEASLGSLAKRTGGIYVRSTSGDPRLNALEKRIRALAPQDYESVKTTKPIDRFSYPLGIAFLLMLIWFALSERAVRNSSAAAAILLCMVAALPVRAESAPANGTTQADRALPAQLPVPEAAGAQTEPSGGEQNAEPVTNDPVELFNRGVDAQEQGKLPEAVKQYENALANGVDNIEIRGKVSQNLGVITHTKARAELGGSLQALQQQNLDEAQKKVDASLKVMEQAEEMYRESMRETEDHSAIAKNQSILLADRRKAETLKKKIEELKKMQQQAQKQTQQAKNQQQKENQQKQDQNQSQQKQDQNQSQQKQDQNQQGQSQQKQDQSQQGQNQQKQDQSQQGQNQQKQDQSQQGQNQQKQDQSQQGQDQQKQEQSQSDQQSAQQKTEEARQSAEDLQKKARELGQKKMEQSAEQAKQELDKAREEQRKGNGKSAEEHLNKALEKLGGDPDRKQDPSKQDSKDGKDQKENQEKNDRNQEDSGKQEKPDSQEPQSAQGQPQKEPEEGEIDKSQAAAILEDMAKDEKNLRDAIKAHQKQRYRNAVPAKDW